MKGNQYWRDPWIPLNHDSGRKVFLFLDRDGGSFQRSADTAKRLRCLPGDQSKLNGKHVVLGRVIEGMEASFGSRKRKGKFGVFLLSVLFQPVVKPGETRDALRRNHGKKMMSKRSKRVITFEGFFLLARPPTDEVNVIGLFSPEFSTDQFKVVLGCQPFWVKDLNYSWWFQRFVIFYLQAYLGRGSI